MTNLSKHFIMIGVSETACCKIAARFNAAAAPGPKDGAFMSFNVVCLSQNIVNLPQIHKEFSPEHIYDRQSLLDIGNAYKHQLSPEAAEKLQGLCLIGVSLLQPGKQLTQSERKTLIDCASCL